MECVGGGKGFGGTVLGGGPRLEGVGFEGVVGG